MLATHQTEDVAAMCQKVMVIDRGAVLYTGTPEDLTRQARGQVWLSDQPDPEAKLSWRTSTGQHRVIGHQPRGAIEAEPTLEDGYLLLIGDVPGASSDRDRTSE
jgi:ABC-2 type transport system ATP-binding protein